jgi:hypothetical protein
MAALYRDAMTIRMSAVAGVPAAPATDGARQGRGQSGRGRTLNRRERRAMSGTENSPAGTLQERLRLGVGFAAADLPRILGALSARSGRTCPDGNTTRSTWSCP